MNLRMRGDQVIPVHCRECHHEWWLRVQMPMPMKVFVQFLRDRARAGCPSCQGKTILMGRRLP